MKENLLHIFNDEPEGNDHFLLIENDHFLLIFSSLFSTPVLHTCSSLRNSDYIIGKLNQRTIFIKQ